MAPGKNTFRLHFPISLDFGGNCFLITKALSMASAAVEIFLPACFNRKEITLKERICLHLLKCTARSFKNRLESPMKIS